MSIDFASDGAHYIVLTTGGLETIAADCIQDILGVPVTKVLQPPASAQWAKPPPEPPDRIFPGEASGGKLHFRLPWPTTREEWKAQHDAIASLPCTCALLAPLATSSELPNDAASGLPLCRELMRSVTADRWDAAVKTWRYCRAEPPALSPDGLASSAVAGLTFRASACRDGKHAFDSPAVAQAVGGAILDTRPGLRVDLEGFDIEVVAIVCATELLLGINLWHGARQSFRAKLCPEPRPGLPHNDCGAALRPSTAHLMLRLAGVAAGDVVLDPMCGIGTVPVVAAATTQCAFALGGDVDPHSLEQAARNGRVLAAAHRSGAKTLDFRPFVDGPPHMYSWHATERLYPRRADGGGGGVLPCLWSAAELPLRDALVDVTVVDLPFGVHHKVAGGKNGLRTLYMLSFAEVARVTRPGGRLVALAISRKCLSEPMDGLVGGGLRFWDPVTALQINCGGSFAWIFVWRRTGMRVERERVQQALQNKKAPKVRLGEKEMEMRKTGRRKGVETSDAAGDCSGAGGDQGTRRELRQDSEPQRGAKAAPSQPPAASSRNAANSREELRRARGATDDPDAVAAEDACQRQQRRLVLLACAAAAAFLAAATVGRMTRRG